VLDRVQRMLLARDAVGDSAAVALVLLARVLPEANDAADSARVLLFRGEAHAVRGACGPARAAFTAAKALRGAHGAAADRYIAALAALDCE
jgi:hypothetical protein